VTTCRRLAFALCLIALALVGTTAVAIAQELPVSPPAPGVLDPESVQPVVPYSVGEQLAARGEDIDDLSRRHPWVPDNAPFPLNFGYVQGSWTNPDGSSFVVYCLTDVAAEHPLWYQENVLRTAVSGGVRCNARLNEAYGGGITGTVRSITFPGGYTLASAPLGAQHQVPEGQGSGWQAYGTATFDRANKSSSQQVKLEVRIELPVIPGAKNVGWNSHRDCTKEGNRVIHCGLWSPPFQTIPYPCPQGKTGLQPGTCANNPQACNAPQYGIQPNCSSLGPAIENALAPSDSVGDPEDYYRDIIGNGDDAGTEAAEDQVQAVLDQEPASDLLQSTADGVNDDASADLTDEQIWAGHEANVEAIDAATEPPQTLLYPSGTGSDTYLVPVPTSTMRGGSSPGGGSTGLNAKEREYCKKPANWGICLKANSARSYAERFLHKYYQGKNLTDGYKGNAYLHCTWIGVTAVKGNDDKARNLGELHEAGTKRPAGMSEKGFRLHKIMDIHNNAEGIYYQSGYTDGSVKTRSNRTSRRCRREANNGTLWRMWPLDERNFSG